MKPEAIGFWGTNQPIMEEQPPLLAHLYACPLIRRGPNNTPQPVDLLDVKTETRLLVECLQQSQRLIRWKTECATSHSFRTMLSQGCRALHFTGHGYPGHVTFETSKGEMHMLSSEQLNPKPVFVRELIVQSK